METSTEQYAIRTSVFEGPLELLIELVEKRKLLINDISLAEVTDEYIQQVSEMQERSLPGTAQFVALAATLLLIKSKSLLPILDLTDEEEATIEDLEQRLKIYQVYKDASQHISTTFLEQPLYEARFNPPRETLFLPDQFCTQDALTEALTSVLHTLPKNKTPQANATVKPTISLEQMMDQLRRRVETQLRVTFSELRVVEPEHKNIIVSFLAILELFKQGDVLITQTNRFSDIEIERESFSTPRY